LIPIVNAQGLSKQYGPAPLFQNISLTVLEGDRIGLIGPNGSGKSTLLEILSGHVKPDQGEISTRKRTRLSFVRQNSEFESGATIRSVIDGALDQAGVPEADRAGRSAEILGRAGFEDLDVAAATLSGGWRKRLAIVEGIVQGPDILLLDEPTNHLDLAGIAWLEGVLQTALFACVVVSHDRYLLENAVTDVVELNRAYADGFLRVKGTYGAFLEAKEAYLHAQGKHQESLANRVHSEVEWLRRGPKARRTKAKARIEKAHALIDELAEVNARTRSASAKIDFSASGRQTKHLIEVESLAYEVEGRSLFKGLQFTLKAGMKLGLVGANGSGKTTLLRLLRGEYVPSQGTIRRAEFLRIVYFDQNRTLDPDLTLRRAFAPDSDSVVYQDRVIHVAAWASRFLFTSSDLERPIGKLSGGERARVLIAQLMLQPADVLLLDEPTNDLDIPTLEILEESLLEFQGALVLVTHDRYMLDRVSTVVVGLDGLGEVEVFADYSQWDAWQRDRQGQDKASSATGGKKKAVTDGKKKLGYLEARELASIEQRIADAEQHLDAKRAMLDEPAIASDGARLLAASAEIEKAQKILDALYDRWAELEEKQALS
jgi:ATP-binding cassette subfamily F protein uup